MSGFHLYDFRPITKVGGKMSELDVDACIKNYWQKIEEAGVIDENFKNGNMRDMVVVEQNSIILIMISL